MADGVYRRRYRAGGEMRESRYWTITWLDEHGKRWRRSTKYTARELAVRERSRRVEEVERRKAGLPDLAAERARRIAEPLALAAAYITACRQRGLAESTVTTYRRRLEILLDGVASLAEVTPGWIAARLETVARRDAPLRYNPTRNAGKGTGARTVNYYHQALSAFFTWCVKSGHWDANPVRQVSRRKVVGRADQERRPLSPAELAALVDAAPQHRAACYLLAATAGLRRSELAALREDEVDLEARVWHARAQWTKNRKAARLPLPQWTCDVLREYLAAYPPDRIPRHGGKRARGGKLFAAVPRNTTLAADLIRAGVQPVTPAGKVDMHALARYTYARWLAVSGVPLATAQELMRHSDPRITANIYTRFFLDDLTRAVSNLRRPEPNAQA